jgi:hypothetical protein
MDRDYLTPILSKPVAGEIPKEREVGTNPPADRIADIVMLFARGCRNGRKDCLQCPMSVHPGSV